MKTEKEIRMKLAEIILTYNDLKSHGMLTATKRPKLTGQKEILEWILDKGEKES